LNNSQIWRFIPLLEASGKVQMAIDRWLLQQHQQGKQPCSLRFYTWSPPAISLGYHQRRYPGEWHNLIWQGQPLDIVRRPTGGRAVLHQGDLTYMIVTSNITGRILEVYQKISEFLRQGWRSLGVELYYGQGGREYAKNPNCFTTATSADLITAFGQKLIGSALFKQGNYILQHGSMRLATDSQLYSQVFNSSPPPVLELSLSTEKIVEALTIAARDYFAIELINQPLSEEEWSEIMKLIGEQ